MTRGRVTAYGQHMTEHFNDPRRMNDLSHRAFGMSSADLEMSLQCAVALSQGRTPTGAALKWAQQSGKAQYGWDSQTVNRALKEASEKSNPMDRIHAYLTAGNNRDIPMETLKGLSDLVTNYAQADFEVDLMSRLDKGRPEDTLRTNFEKMPATDRAKEAATDRQSIRNLVSMQVGAPNRELTFEEKREATKMAREELANRIDFGTTKVGGSGSLRDTLRDSIDISTVRSASEEVGLPDFIAEADSNYEDVRHAFDKDYDVTATLRGDLTGSN